MCVEIVKEVFTFVDIKNLYAVNIMHVASFQCFCGIESTSAFQGDR